VVWISVSGCAGDTRDMRAQPFWDFHNTTRHYGDSYFTAVGWKNVAFQRINRR